MTLLGLLPAAAFAAWFIAIGPSLGKGNLRMGVLRLTALWAVGGVLIAEGLSLFSAWRPASLTAAWVIMTAIGIVLAARRGSAWREKFPLTQWITSWTRAERAMALGSLVVLSLTGLVAWFAPPSTWDSLNYRMPRVAHWAQLGALRHFATGIEIQNNMPPGAEIQMAQTYILSGGDRWVNFIGWFSILAAAVAASELAADLGAGGFGQWASGVFLLALPMAVIQASSTTTDSVEALWVMYIAVEGLKLARIVRPRPSEAIYIGIGAGLAILTKPTAFAYLPPLAVAVLVGCLRKAGPRRTFTLGLVALAAVLLLNFGHWARNFYTYGNPIAPPARIAKHQLRPFFVQGWISNLLRNAALHAGTPSPHVNKGIALVVLSIHKWIGLDPNDPRTTVNGVFRVQPLTTNEDKAGNSLHAYLLIGLVAFVAARWKRLPGWLEGYSVASLATFFLFSALFQWQVFGSRYHLPFFALMAPLAGYALGGIVRRSWATAIVLVLLVASVPWLVGIKSRPLISGLDDAYVGSILTEERSHLYFANGTHLEPTYRAMTGLIQQGGCRHVGLRLAGWQAEYPLWVLLGAPDQGLTMEWRVSETESERYRPEDRQLCAVICYGCRDDVTYGELVLAEQKQGFWLYLKPMSQTSLSGVSP